ncbi:MAG TPA: hypothetical protein VGP33_00420, partial [Chloroflexota bacterium]|nr:hypothetical protein [Chloroflexota bacterium]
PIWAVAIVLSGALRGSGDTRFPLLANASSIWASVLLAWLVVAGFANGLPGAWLCFVIVTPLAAITIAIRFMRTDWQHARRVAVPAVTMVDAG